MKRKGDVSVHYASAADNIVTGRSWLRGALNVTPGVEWTNDPFGYSASLRVLFQQSGLARLVVQRVLRGLNPIHGIVRRIEGQSLRQN